ncbi:MAG: nitroreductase family protein [Fimbriimonadaceae bacterium]|nr:nitroreductase family protein [Fimbriimonadaceae bacterium]
MFDESFDHAWRLRFGSEPPEADEALAPFVRHRSVREYAARDVPESVVRGLVGAAQSAATSSNLQLWSLISIQEPERRAAIARLCADQKQVHTAPWFFAFLVDHHRLRGAALAVGQQPTGLDYTEFFAMALVDASLAAERMVCAAESLGLGICYIGALRNDPEGVRTLLNLPEGTFGAFGLCLGWPAEESTAAIKPRLRQEDVWFRETYGQPDPAEYDARMRAFYESQQMKGDVTWRMRSGRRVDDHHLTGREVLKEWLLGQGFGRR